MNGTTEANDQLLNAMTARLSQLSQDIDIAIFPPAVYLHQVQSQLETSGIYWGTQNVSSYLDGPYTGEISAMMLADFKARYTLIGHSERRCLYDELDIDEQVLDKIVAEKCAKAIQYKITPIVCIGETPQEHEEGRTETVVLRMLDALIERQGVKSLSQTILAYEPVWAIGTGQSASPEWAQNVHAYMRERIAQHDKTIANKVRILYGGSVKGNNASSLFAQKDIDGGLVGGASLNADEFIHICQAAITK